MGCPDAAVAGVGDVEVVFGEPGEGRRRERLNACWQVRFERVPPVRSFPSYRGQRNFPGLWWSATTGGHVGFESWLERDQAMVLDFDPAVVGFSSQPFRLLWAGGRRPVEHTPDFFARLADGTGVVVDVRADDRIGPQDAEVFAATARVCRSVGWEYRRVGEVAAVLRANLRWLSGYRHRRCVRPAWEAGLRAAFSCPAGLLDGARAVGDPVAVLPTLFGLLWRGDLVTDVAGALLGGAPVVAAGGGRS